MSATEFRQSGQIRTRDGASFQRLMSSAVAPVVLTATAGRFFGSLRWVARSDVLVGRVMNARTRARSTSDGAASASRFVFCVQVSGRGVVEQSGRRAEINAGEMSLYRTDQPYSLEFTTTGERVGVVLPASTLAVPVHALNKLTGTRFGRADPFIAPVARSIIDYEQALGDTTAASLTRMLDLIVSSVNATVEHRAEAGWPDEREALHRAAMEYIGANLDDPMLSTRRIAAALFVSMRTLQLAFEQVGPGVATTIRQRRLDRAYRDIVSPDRAHVPIGDVAMNWGFGSPSHFTELIRRRYGATPRALRRSATETARRDDAGLGGQPPSRLRSGE